MEHTCSCKIYNEIYRRMIWIGHYKLEYKCKKNVRLLSILVLVLKTLRTSQGCDISTMSRAYNPWQDPFTFTQVFIQKSKKNICSWPLCGLLFLLCSCHNSKNQSQISYYGMAPCSKIYEIHSLLLRLLSEHKEIGRSLSGPKFQSKCC